MVRSLSSGHAIYPNAYVHSDPLQHNPAKRLKPLYIDYLGKAGLIHHIAHEAKRFKAMRCANGTNSIPRPPNLIEALCINSDVGTIRETFFAASLTPYYWLHYPDRGDFLIDETYTVEIGGRKKDFS